jgi:hypothetical protein
MPPELHHLLTSIHGDTLRQFGYLIEPKPSTPPTLRIIIESSKLFTTDNDGIKRYLTGLSNGLIPLLPHFPHLDVSMVNHFGVVKFETQRIRPMNEFNLPSDKEAVLSDRRTMSCEKALLLFKITIKRVLPRPVYQTVANHYHDGPFRRHLAFFKKAARNTAEQLGNSSFREIIQTTDLIHIPLPQHFNTLPLMGKRVLVTVHDAYSAG